MQTKQRSIIEVLTSTLIGFVTAFLSQLAIFPLFEIKVSLETNLGISLYFTGISIIRGYLVRRYFNEK